MKKYIYIISFYLFVFLLVLFTVINIHWVKLKNNPIYTVRTENVDINLYKAESLLNKVKPDTKYFYTIKYEEKRQVSTYPFTETIISADTLGIYSKSK